MISGVNQWQSASVSQSEEVPDYRRLSTLFIIAIIIIVITIAINLPFAYEGVVMSLYMLVQHLQQLFFIEFSSFVLSSCKASYRHVSVKTRCDGND